MYTRWAPTGVIIPLRLRLFHPIYPILCQQKPECQPKPPLVTRKHPGARGNVGSELKKLVLLHWKTHGKMKGLGRPSIYGS